MRRLVADCRYVVLMTGTPAANGLHDLWAQLFLIDKGSRLGHTETDFKKRYFDQGWGEHATPTAKSFAEKRIKAKIEDVVFTLLGADYLKLPPLITNKIIVDLEPEMLKTYRKFVRQYVLEMKEGVGPINAVSAGALTQKLQQVANGIVLDKDKNAHELHRLKIDALRDLVEEAAGQPILVAYSHRADIARIKAEFPYAVELGNNPQTQADWNEGRIRMLLMHPKSGAHGLNLQHGGSLIVWFGLTWSAELHQQLIKRLHRSGQVNAVIVHYIMAAGTIDERIFDSLTTLGEDQARFMRSLSRIIEEEYKEAA
jgi:SNF2 family DNA or RNA helicase